MKQFKTAPFIILIAGIFLTQACQQRKANWELKGTTDSGAAMVYLYRIGRDFQKSLIDSATIQNTGFAFTGTNDGDAFEPYFICTNMPESEGTDCLLGNGDKLKVDLKEHYQTKFSGTDIADDLNHYLSIKQAEMAENLSFSKELTQDENNDESQNHKLISYREKVQELENEKIEFLHSIIHPDLNGYLVRKELENSGVIEKEVVRKYMEALTAEGALTDNGIQVHRIYDVFDAYALSLEMEFLDTATIRARYENLDEENRSSVYARRVLEKLNESN